MSGIDNNQPKGGIEQQFAGSESAEAKSSGLDPAEQFMARFRGNDRAHGVHVPRERLTDAEKPEHKKGKSWVDKTGGPTVALWREHLAGTRSIGAFPLLDDGTCTWGCIDGDFYQKPGLDHITVEQFERRVRDTPLVVCRSKSGGVHAFLFVSEPVPAGLMREKLAALLAALGLPKDTEIFPKQSAIDAGRGDFGNWLNVPYFDAEKSMRYCVRDGEALTPESFLAYADEKELSREQLEALDHRPDSLALPRSRTSSQPETRRNVDPAISEEFPGAPPCVHAMLHDVVQEGGRDNALFHIGHYVKRAFPDWQEKLEDVNRRFFNPPLTAKEVVKTIKSLEKKSHYTCSKSPMAGYCDKAACEPREFGAEHLKGGNLPDGFPEIAGELRLMGPDGETETFIRVNGRRVGPLTPKMMRRQSEFGDRVYSDTGVMLPPLGIKAFTALIQRVAAECREDDKPEETTRRGRLKELVVEFCGWAGQHRGSEYSEAVVFDNKAYFDERLNTYFFRLPAFQRWLDFRREPYGQDMGTRLKDLGVEYSAERFLTGRVDQDGNPERKQVRLWKVNVEKMQVDLRPLPSGILTGPTLTDLETARKQIDWLQGELARLRGLLIENGIKYEKPRALGPGTRDDLDEDIPF